MFVLIILRFFATRTHVFSTFVERTGGFSSLFFENKWNETKQQ